MTFGPLLLTLSDLKEVDQMPFIGPEDMVRFRNLERYNLTLPVKGVKARGATGFADGVRATPKKLPSKHLSGLSTEEGKPQSIRALT